MPKCKKTNISKVRSILHEHTSEFIFKPKGELFCKFCDCLESENCQKIMVEAHRLSAKHQRGSFHETESSQTFLKHAIPDFADKLLCFISIEQTYPVCWLILYMKCFAYRISIENVEN